jgi:hypothetical protein
MRWLALVVMAACGGKSASSEQPITNSIPPASQICEDTIVQRSTLDPAIGLVISEETFFQRAMHQHQPALRDCYEQRLAYKPYLSGKVVLEITVADGKATRIRTKGFDAELDRCLCETLAKLHFATLSGGEVKASYPLYFTRTTM